MAPRKLKRPHSNSDTGKLSNTRARRDHHHEHQSVPAPTSAVQDIELESLDDMIVRQHHLGITDSMTGSTPPSPLTPLCELAELEEDPNGEPTIYCWIN